MDQSISAAIDYLLAEFDGGTYTSDPYTLAIVSYALATEQHGRAQQFMEALDSLAISESEHLYFLIYHYCTVNDLSHQQT